MHYRKCTRVVLSIVFKEFDMVYIYIYILFAIFFFSPSLSIDKKSTLAKFCGAEIVIGCIYRHSMELSEFNNHYLANFSLSNENKKVVLLGDFNADFLKYDNDSNISDFLDAMYSNSFLPNIAS